MEYSGSLCVGKQGDESQFCNGDHSDFEDDDTDLQNHLVHLPENVDRKELEVLYKKIQDNRVTIQRIESMFSWEERPTCREMSHQLPFRVSELDALRKDTLKPQPAEGMLCFSDDPITAWRLRKFVRNEVRRARISFKDAVSRRPGRAPIMSLPDEMLNEIFSHLVLPDESGWPQPTPVQHSRLTCRRFSRIASTFLVPRLEVDISLPSLVRLEEISQHPLISRSVESVAFKLDLYKTHIASSFAKFIEYCLYLLDRDLGDEYAESIREIDWEWWGLGRRAAWRIICDMREVRNIWEQLRQQINQSLDGLMMEEVLEPQPFHQEFLAAQHEKFRRLSKEQRDLLENGFFQRVATAMARLPRAKSIRFEDSNTDRNTDRSIPFPFASLPENPTQQSILETLAKEKFFLQPEPFAWSSVYGFHFRPELNRFMASTLSALAQAGKSPHHIALRIDETEDRWLARTRAKEYEETAAGLKELNSFSFDSQGSLDARSVRGEKYAASLLAPFLDAPRLRSLHFNLDISDGCSRGDENFGKALAAKPRPTLTSIVLQGLSIQHRHLLALLGTPRKMEKIELTEIRLQTGTWAAVLAVLRQFDCPRMILDSPSGAEVEHIPAGAVLSMLDDTPYDWPDECCGLSVVEGYINGKDILNPFQDSRYRPAPGAYERMAEDDRKFLSGLEREEAEYETEGDSEIEHDESNSEADL
ncbi:hypothetical protein B0T16DRAFT_416982 [Cercophora newfieldiana]|uniref:F-box domain-containing protein n=1 Tax=Cercophora newfieldiana TaxID=92897 RepID=A0AA40CMM2_9PEZI|nr:hypothetical protein B0T16DRAFT_416982 [Cercophora newfieldiana]